VLAAAFSAAAQDPYQVAPENYHLVFENEWARATRVTYRPGDKLPVHSHPPTPTTVYVYVTDGGPIRFGHVTGEHVEGVMITRKAVQAGAIRFAHGAPETHTVEYLGDAPTDRAAGSAGPRCAAAGRWGIRKQAGPDCSRHLRRRSPLSRLRSPRRSGGGGHDERSTSR
jgi:beta-alanine degradation protein BauB